MSFLSGVLSYIYISTIFYNILLCQSGQGYGYIWQVKGHKILCHFINTADKWCLVNGQQIRMWLGTFTHACTAPWGMVVGNWRLQGRQPSPWGRSPVSFEEISQPSFFSWWLLTWFGTFTLASAASRGFRYGPALFRGCCPKYGAGPLWVWADRPTFILQPVAPDVIWLIYSHLYCSSRDGGRD